MYPCRAMSVRVKSPAIRVTDEQGRHDRDHSDATEITDSARLSIEISAFRIRSCDEQRVGCLTFSRNARDGRRSRLFRNDDAPASRIAEGLHCASAA